MSIIGSNILAGAAGSGVSAYEIEQSLRFDGSAYLSRTPSSAGNRKTWTWSGWVKRAKLGTYQAILGGYTSATFDFTIGFSDTDGLRFYSYNSGLQASLLSNDKFRDPSAWYHIVYAVDTTQGTSSNRVKIYVNNRQVTSFSTATYPGSSVDLSFNTTNTQRIGQTGYPSMYFDGYLAEVNFIDGSALAPSDFGEYDNNGVWRPIKYAGSYTGNSFYLKFASGDGTDSSGLSNTWTANNFTTSGTGTDVMSDTPTTNWATLNAVDKASQITLSNGNLTFVKESADSWDNSAVRGTFAVSSGKWYWEITKNSTTIHSMYGVALGNASFSENYGGTNYETWTYYSGDGTKSGDSDSGASYGASFTNGDVIGIALDCDNGTLVFYKNGTSQGTAYSTLSGKILFPWVAMRANGTGSDDANFGQRAFAYTPPTGFKALNTSNLPAPDIADGSEYFNTLTYTGNGTGSFTGVGFQPDFTWIKCRNAVESHDLFDVVRGAPAYLQSNTTAAEQSYAGYALTSFDSDGFTLNDPGGGGYHVNKTGNTYVAWNWLGANGTSSNTAGSITSTVSANPTAGFSIVSYTGNATAGATVGHGLGVAPSMIIIKNRDDSASSFWCVYHKSAYVSAADPNVLYLNSTQGQSDDTNVWGPSPDFSSTIFELGDYNGSNGSGDDMIAYCFAEVEGYSKFGSYTGNNSSDGPFVYCGFKPRWIMRKATGDTSNWVILDTARDTYNETDNQLLPNTSGTESDGSDIDILSNGFKMRSAALNGSTTYIFAAFASHPFGGSGVSPATAR